MASKAAEWAADVKRRASEVERIEQALAAAEEAIPEPERFHVPRPNGVRGDAPNCIAFVRSDGHLAIGDTTYGSGMRLSPDEALALAAWIISTFGEPETKEPTP